MPNGAKAPFGSRRRFVNNNNVNTTQVRTMYGIRVLLAFILSLFLGIGSAWADTANYQILIDTDHNPASGCTLNSAQGSFAGAELRLLTTVSFGNGPTTVSGVQLQHCVGGAFGAPLWSSPGGWPVGQGTNADIIETLLPLTALGGATSLRLGVVAEANGSLDTLFQTNGQGNGQSIDFPLPGGGGGAGPFDPPQPIPVLHPLTALGLALLLAGLAAYGLRRRRGLLAFVLLAVSIGAAGLAWAAMQLDGQTSDWTGQSPLASDPRGDALGMADLLALFAKVEGQWLHLRLDVAGVVAAPGNQAPQVNAGAEQNITLPINSVTLAGVVNDDGLPNPPAQVTVTWSKSSGPGSVSFGNSHAASTSAQFSAAGTYVLHLAAFDGQLTAGDDVQITVNPEENTGLPPDPSTVAPPIDPTVATTTYAATEFLYSGSDPIQTGVAPGTIDPVRTAALRGRVLNSSGQPLPGVTLNILTHPEFGQTLSRADGWFDLAVNGGGYLSVDYQKAGYLPAQRQVKTPWQDFVVLPDVVLLAQEAKVTLIDLTNETDFQVAQGSLVTDQDGARQATLLIPPGTSAQVFNPDGSTRPVTTLTLRFTEYTVGSDGPKAMPGPLPPSSGYTYAVELSAAEAGIKIDGKDVLFNQPVPFYLDNFLNFPVGIQVPVGYYDRARSAWIPSDDGRVIKILDIIADLAVLDTDGDGLADDTFKLAELGITDTERYKLATLYTKNKILWRVTLYHLSTYDLNYGVVPTADAKPPLQPPPQVSSQPEDKPDCGAGSIIECQNQILQEMLPVIGTPFSLNHASDRVPGRKGGTILISLSGSTVPASLKRIELSIGIAGRVFSNSFPAAPNQSTLFDWDGLNAYGGKVSGLQSMTVRVTYVYDGFYALPPYIAASFGVPSGQRVPGNIPSRTEATLSQEYMQKVIGPASGFLTGFGGWTMNVHHSYDPVGLVLWQGDGSRRSAKGKYISAVITTIAGGTYSYPCQSTGDGGDATKAQICDPSDIAVAPDGGILIAEYSGHRIRKVGTDGIIATIAGDGNQGYGGDGGAAVQAKLNNPTNIALGSDGSILIADYNNGRIRRVGPDSRISTVVEGIRAYSLAIAPDGNIFAADYFDPTSVYRIGLDGVVTTFAGDNSIQPVNCYFGDGGPATEGCLCPKGLAVSQDGSMFISGYCVWGLDSSYYSHVYRVSPDGIITKMAGTGWEYGYSGDGGLATQAQLFAPNDVAIAPDGSLMIADYGNGRVRRVGPDGFISTVAGGGDQDVGEGIPATRAVIWPEDIAVAPNGSFYIAERSLWVAGPRIRKVSPSLPGFSPEDIIIASEDGESLYQFSAEGRHLRTLNARTGANLYSFGHDASGRLISVTDGDGDITQIERDADGNPTAIVAPFGQRTTLTLDANGYLASLTNPAGERYQMEYSADGLLTKFTDPLGHASTMSYDALGRLLTDANAGGGSQTLVRTDLANGHEVEMSSALNRATTYRLENLTTGDQRRVNTRPDTTQTETLIGTDGTTQLTEPDGTQTTSVQGPDPRFGMQAPVTTSTQVVTGGLTALTTRQRTAVLSDPNNPLSLVTLTNTATLNGRTSTSVYDAASRQEITTSAAGRQSIQDIDAKGHPTLTQIGDLEPIAYAYDARGRLQSLTQGSGAQARTTSFGYDSNGFLSDITDALNRHAGFRYDPAGRVTEQTLPDGRQIQYGYDAKGNQTGVTPPGRPAHAFSYTPVDLQEEYSPPTLPLVPDPRTLYSYNLDKELTRIDRPDGQSLIFAYDAAGRLETLTLPNGVVGYGYDPATGKLIQIDDPDGGSLAYTYNGALLTQSAWSGDISGSVGRVYDNDFRVATLKVNDVDAIDFHYDDDSLLIQAGSLNLSRHAQNGLLTGSTLGNVTDGLGYNGFGELTNYSAQYSGAPLFATQFSRDKLGRITQKMETIGGVTTSYDYAYDLAGRLIGVDRQNGATITTYAYDNNGNRLSQTLGAVTTNGTYDNQDRMLSYGTANYAYTANGELLTKTIGASVTGYNYDVLGNLRHLDLPGGTTIDYVIDGKNRRIGKKVNGALVQGFLYQSDLAPIAELDGNNNLVSRFVYATGVNVPDSMIKNGVTYRLIKDHLGSPRLVIDIATGAIAQQMDYDEFGNVINDTNPGFQPFGFAGGLYDRHTGLVRFGARDYDPVTGRWTVKDPIGFGGGTNYYGYTNNNPIHFIDPKGFNGSSPDVNNSTTVSPWILTIVEILLGNQGLPAIPERELAGVVNSVAEQVVPPLIASTTTGVKERDVPEYKIGISTWLVAGRELDPFSITCSINPGLPECRAYQNTNAPVNPSPIPLATPCDHK